MDVSSKILLQLLLSSNQVLARVPFCPLPHFSLSPQSLELLQGQRLELDTPNSILSIGNLENVVVSSLCSGFSQIIVCFLCLSSLNQFMSSVIMGPFVTAGFMQLIKCQFPIFYISHDFCSLVPLYHGKITKMPKACFIGAYS